MSGTWQVMDGSARSAYFDGCGGVSYIGTVLMVRVA
jgi:hypothetical protein